MASSSPDQSTTTNSVPPPALSKKHLWLGLVITFLSIVLCVGLILWLLTYLGFLPMHWFTLFIVPILGIVGTFIKTTLSDKDFQQSLRVRLGKVLSGDTSSKEDKASQPSPAPIAITINNTNTATNAPITTPQLSGSSSSASPPATATPVPSPVASKSLFFPAMKLVDPKEFYGRSLQREQLLSRTRNGGCTSIVGPRRSGKTWLVSYLRLVAPDRLGTHCCMGHLSATLPSVATQSGFSGEALKALGSFALPSTPDLKHLEDLVRGMIAQNRTPVLCIDEFEGFTHHPTEFDLHFFEGLRAITELGLSLVILSKAPLIDLVSENTKTSPFFNVFLQLKLGSFPRAEAEQFVREKSAEAQFTDLERRYFLAYSQQDRDQYPPLLLQLFGEHLHREKYSPSLAQQYSPEDPAYWQGFKQRLDEAYRGMVKL